VHRAKPENGNRSVTGSDFLQLDIRSAPPGGRTDWLTAQLRGAISDGRLPVGSQLPPTRVLAAELGVSRGVVTEAYQRLVEDGHVAGRGRAGTTVVSTPAPVARPVASSTVEHDVFGHPDRADLFETVRAAPASVDLTPGVPDLTAFPRAAWLRAERSVFARLAPAAFGYGDPRGAQALRGAVATWLARTRGIATDPDEIVIVAGVSQGLGLLAQVLRADGIDAVAVEDPGSLGVRQHLRNWGLATPPVPVDDDGVRVDALRSGTARAVILTPAHQFPIGVVLGGDRRRQLLAWADGGGLVIEDDYDAEHRYDRPPVPALKSVRPERVCYCGTVSKLLAPALRVGWMLVPARYHDALVAAKRAADLGNAVLPQLVLATLMESGAMERQLRLLRRRHVRRRDAMIDAVRVHLPGAAVHGAAAGLHLTITLTGDAERVADVDVAAAALARGVKVQPLSWHRQRPGVPGLVLGYAASPPSEIERAVAEIGAALRDVLAGR
jgi:GntR family transcriptional regulator/MocR family aminotransferase